MITSVLLTSKLFTLAACTGFHDVPIGKADSSLNKRSDDGYIVGDLENEVNYYYAYPKFGEDLQTIKLGIDTGSSDTWVYGKGAGASYEYDNSSATDVGESFSIGYLDGNSAKGYYVKDNITWGGHSVQCQFGYVPKSTRDGSAGTGLIGLSYPGSESTSNVYPNYPVALKEQGVVDTASFSMFLDSKDGKNASLLFGAIDKSRYTGELKTINMTDSKKYEVAYEINGVSNKAVLDCGTSYSTLPQDVADAAAKSVNATWNNNSKHYDYTGTGKPTSNLTITFDGFDLIVPYTELWRPYATVSGYYLGFQPDGHIFGDNFLRSWYVVYDLDNHQISLGQANYDIDTEKDYKLIKPEGVQASL